MNDVVAAARQVASRFEAAKRAGHTDVALRISEVIALLPVLDALAAGRGDAGREERMTATIVAELRRQSEAATYDSLDYFDSHDVRKAVVDGRVDLPALARAAIALADAERAAETAE